MSKAKYYEGQKVQGLIINVTKDAIYVEINEEEGVVAILYANDLEGYVEGQKLRDSYNEGQEFEAFVKQVTKDKKTGEPLYILSTKLESKRDELKAFEEIKANDEIISAKVVRVTRAGADLIYKNQKLFLPIKQIDMSEEALNGLKGENLDVIIIAVNMERLQVIVSHTIAMKKQHRLAKEAAYAALEVGQVHEGEVVSVLPYGAIVSIGEVSGLLHQSELDYKMVRNVADRLHVGDKLTVKIIGIEGNRISLSVKALTPHPWEIVKEQFHVDDVFDGVVSKIIPAGLLIKLTDQYAGLMPRSEFSWTFVEKLEDHIAEGDTIKVKVLNIDDEKRRVSLSHKATEDNAWGEVNLKKGDNIKVVVASIEEKGAKVNYLRVQGFLPINEVTNTRRIGKVDEFFPVGTEIDVVVIECVPSRARLKVSSRALENAKERESYDKYVAQQERETPTSTIGDFLEQQEEDKQSRKKGRK